MWGPQIPTGKSKTRGLGKQHMTSTASCHVVVCAVGRGCGSCTEAQSLVCIMARSATLSLLYYTDYCSPDAACLFLLRLAARTARLALRVEPFFISGMIVCAAPSDPPLTHAIAAGKVDRLRSQHANHQVARRERDAAARASDEGGLFSITDCK